MSAVTNAFFFDAIRPMFGGTLTQQQVDGCKVIVDAWEDRGDGDDAKLAYLLATAKHETADTMQPIYERGARAYFNKYEPGTKIGKALGNTMPGDGYLFRGRGYVQLTGRANYTKAGKKLDAPLVMDPDAALEPSFAARILIDGCMGGWFTGRKLGDYIVKGIPPDFVNARRVVNGTDKAELIAKYADGFLAALMAAGSAPAPRTIPAEPAYQPSGQVPSKHGGLIAAIVAVVAAVAAGFAKLMGWV